MSSLTFSQIVKPNTLDGDQANWLHLALTHEGLRDQTAEASMAARRIELARQNGGAVDNLQPDELRAIVAALGTATALGGTATDSLSRVRRNLNRLLERSAA